MLAGEMYNPADPVLLKEREDARRKVRIYNQTLETEGEKRTKLLKELLGSTGENFFANFDCTILDVCEVRFGDNCMLAPGVQKVEP